MLRDYLEKNQIKSLDQSITSEQINLLKTNLKEEIVQKQNEIDQLYQTKIDDIQQIDEQTKNLIEKCDDLEKKRQYLIEQVDNYTKLEDHARHINSNYHQVHHLNQFINGLKQLIDLQKQIYNCRQLCKKGLLNDAKILYEKISNIFDDDYLFPKDSMKIHQQHDSLYESLQKSFKQLNIELNQTHQTLWNDGIDRTMKHHLKLQLFFLDQLFQCRFIEDRGEKILIEKNIQTLATFCYQRFIEILIEKPMTIVIKEEINQIDIFLEENDENDDNQIEEFNRKIKNLKEFFEILNQYVLSRMISIQPSNQKTIESLCLIKIFSPIIINDLTELIREHLLNLIPNNFEYLESFRSLLTTIIDFEKYLQKIEFYSSNTISDIFSSVVGNIDESIIKSRCRKYLTQCRDLLQSNSISNNSLKTIEIGDNENLFQENNRLKSQYQEEISTNLLTPTISLDGLDANMFRFPRTIIIEHVHEYIEIIRKILQEADQLDMYAAHLCATVRNLIELFQIIYGNLHKKEAEEIPYLTALHFNTYMYIAHECLILGEEFYHLKSKTADKQPITFVDFVPIFRNQAASLLQTQLDTQKEILRSFIREVGAFHNLTNDEENKVLLKRSIHKSTMLIGNLSNNWKNVFSSRVYFRVIGHLCDYVSQLLIKETLALEDIPEEECQLMVDAYTQWSNFLQDLLIKNELSPGLNLIGEFAPNLTKFNELCLVLNSSMQTIVDRWFNGQGPLASQFTAIQIKQLIRALFQTSERRTAALAKIQ